MIFGRPLSFSLLYAACYVVMLAEFARHFWRRFKNESESGASFNFRIMDIWAGILILTPSLIVIAYALNLLDERGWDYPYTSLYAMLGFALLTGQITGIFVGRIFGDLPQWGGRKTHLDSASLVMFGGFMGMLPGLVTVALFVEAPYFFYAVWTCLFIGRMFIKDHPSVK